MTTSPKSGAAALAPVDIAERFTRFSEPWLPKRIATFNDYDVRIARMRGEFVWHAHPDTDEFFLLLGGELTIRLRDSDGDGAVREARLAPGQILVVPRGVEHCPVAATEARVLMLEPAGTPNTGDAGGERTQAVEELD